MKLFIFFISFCLALSSFYELGLAKEITLSEEAQSCLECHAKIGIIKKFENNESIQAYVDVNKFKLSVHNKLTCSQCHKEFSAEKHPERTFRSKKQYKIKASMVCKKCHPDNQIFKIPAHYTKNTEDDSPVCTDCHSAHSVMPVKGGKFFNDERQYCLGCHKHKIHMGFRNKEKLVLMVDVSQLDSSVHSKLTCSDCHYGFSSEEHPKRDFRTKRDFSIASAEICRRCHFDKHMKILDSSHNMLTHGNLNAPVCTDCHGAHSISHFGKQRTLIAQRCRKCHPDVYDTYVNSVHGKALFDQNNEDVPVCIDCHKAHDINNPLALDYRERIPEMCGNCHSNKAIMVKYGLSTNVVKTYLSDFHGITLDFYKKQRETLQRPGKQIAVCTDCHGTHNISSTIGTDANLFRANLIKRCQKCHQTATKNFPDIWLSHYEPDLKKAPIVFIVNLLYKIFMPIMIIGLLLQILLHIWRYAVNR